METKVKLSKKRRILFYVIMFMIPLLIAELSFQVFYRITNGSFLFERMVLPIYDTDEYRYYKVKPNLNYRHQTNEYDVTYYTNELGWRTNQQRREIKLNKDESVFRILFLGPSFTFGWANNYDDTFISIVEKDLNIGSKKVEVINLGTPAQPVNYQLCWFKKIGYKLNPDLIVQTVYGDPSGIASGCIEPENPPIVEDGYLYLTKPSFSDKLFILAKSSAIVFYGWYIYQYFIGNEADDTGLGTELYENTSEDSTAEICDINFNSYIEYTSFVKSTLKKEITIIFLHIPFSYVVRPSDLSRWKHKGWENPYKLRKKARQIEKSLEKQNIIFVNPIDELMYADKDTRMYYFLDLHFTASGNKVTADKLLGVINEIVSSNESEIQN